ncbi:hypothetical protein [Corallococcus exercitus]|uniref:hypothetical protein n=1 Tax=Corallococcus exercitus TaxID=2316736 RepID=UPI0035D4908C
MTTPSGDELNTDPWIWHPGFLWSICRQTQKHEIAVVRSLTPGDLVLFGSVLDRTRWCLDTVLVVERRLAHPPNDAAYDRFVRQPLARVPQPLKPIAHPRPTKGRPWSENAETFSFAPVQHHKLNHAPARVDISTIVTSLKKADGTPASAANAQALVACPHSNPSAVWQQVADAVSASGMKLGICFTYPP